MPAGHPGHGGLAAAALADEAEDIALVELERDIVGGLDRGHGGCRTP